MAISGKSFSFWRAAGLVVVFGLMAHSVSAQQIAAADAATPDVAQAQSTAVAQGGEVAPTTLSLSEGTSVHLRTTDYLSALNDGYGGQFIGVLVAPVVVDGWLVARAGQYIVGEAASGDKKTVSLRLNQLILVDGGLVRIETSPVTAGLDTPPQSMLSFTLTKAATISRVRGRVTFRTVTAEDYTNFPLGNAPTKIPFGYDPPCCIDQHGYGQFAGDGYGYHYYYGAGYVPPPVQIRYYGWHGNRWGW
jgi:hypothetical protein